MTSTRSTSSRVLSAGLWFALCLGAWSIVLDLSHYPLIPQLDPSWIAVLTRAAVPPLQFGSEITYTYGPLSHIAYSIYSEALFTSHLWGRSLLTAIFVALVFVASRPLTSGRRVLFLVTIFLVATVSLQARWAFTILTFGWLLCRPSRLHNFLAVFALFSVVVAALIKTTFLWLSILIIGAAALWALLHRKWLRAVLPTIAFFIALSGLWIATGQELSGLPKFFITGWDVTSGYARAMNVPATSIVLLGGLAILLAVIAFLSFLLWRSERSRTSVISYLMLVGTLLVHWKLGYCRADAHVTEFFFFAIVAASAGSIFFEPGLTRTARVVDWTLPILVLAGGSWFVVREMPSTGDTLLSTLQHRSAYNLSVLLHPAAERARCEAADAQARLAYDLPKIRSLIGAEPVTVFGSEQAIAFANGFNFTPLPCVQTYCAYTPKLAERDAAFLRSERAPAFLLGKIQPIDFRLPSVEDPLVFLQMAYGYSPVATERGYLLLKRRPAPTVPRPGDLPIATEGRLEFGQTLRLPAGSVWCELDFRERLAGKILGAVYQLPPVEIELGLSDNTTIRRRILPSLGSTGFVAAPAVISESDFFRYAAGHADELAQVVTLRIVEPSWPVAAFNSTIGYRFRTLPSVPQVAAAEAVLRELTGYTDVFGAPAQEVQSGIPVERFMLEGKTFLLVHPVGEVRFAIPEGSTHVSGQFAIRPDAYASTPGVEFAAVAKSNAGGDTTLYRRVLSPRTLVEDRGPQAFKVALPPGSEELILRTLPGPTGAIEWGWAGWSTIEFHGESPPAL